MLTFLVLIIYILSWLIQPLLSYFWVPVYFQYGLPIFKRKYSSETFLDVTERLDRFSTGFTYKPKRTNIIMLRRISPTEIAVRDNTLEFKLFSFKFYYIPVMRGLVRFDEKEATIQMTGYLNYIVVTFYLLLFEQGVRAISRGEWMIPVLAAGIIVVFLVPSFLVQRSRYNNIFESLAKWTKDTDL